MPWRHDDLHSASWLSVAEPTEVDYDAIHCIR